MRCVFWKLVFLVLWFSLISTASAEQVTFDMSGVVRIFDENEPRVFPDINSGDECSVRLTYDQSILPFDHCASCDAASYQHLPPLGSNGLTLSVGSMQIGTAASEAFGVTIHNDYLDHNDNYVDIIGLYSSNPVWPGLPNVGSSSIKLEAAGDPSAFQGTDLPDDLDFGLFGYFEPYAQAYLDERSNSTVYIGCTVSAINKVVDGNTSSGSGITVVPSASDANGSLLDSNPVSFTFQNVVAAGTTSVEVVGTGPALPSGFVLGDPPVYLNLGSTAAFTGNVELCVDYSLMEFTDPDELSLLHHTGAGWQDITISIDADRSEICGLTDSFSPFTVARAKPQLPSLALTIEISNSNGSDLVVRNGHKLNYSVTAQNTGSVSLTDVRITSDILATSSYSCAHLAPNDLCVLSGAVSVTDEDQIRGYLRHIATAEATGVDRQDIVHRVGVINNPALELSHSVESDNDELIYPGDVIEYALVAENVGDVTLAEVIVRDLNLSPNQAVCNNLLVGEQCVLAGKYVVKAHDELNGRFSNLGIVTSSQTSAHSIRLVMPVTSIEPVVLPQVDEIEITGSESIDEEVKLLEPVVPATAPDMLKPDATTSNCVDTDGDGWGWDGSRSCVVGDSLFVDTDAPAAVSGGCVDFDGDGYGWDGQRTCLVTAGDAAQAAHCIDLDGDGWGWNGTSSCRITVPVEVDPEVGLCVDSDGDGWGWNGSASCLMQ